ncbi:MAG: serine/threonine protein kinase [Myxococcales bacterium]|nr:serine/threonine protein kinase [Myxococcales bacterium]
MGEPSFLKCQTCQALSWYADVPCSNPACPPLSVHLVPATGQHLVYTRGDGGVGHVQIVRSLSDSGSCAVFEATGDVRAVVKLPHRQLFVGYLDHAELVKEELRREFAMLMRISSSSSSDKRHLPELLGAGALRDGAPFLVMRFCDGVTLAALIDEGFDRLGTPPSLRMVLEALLGVARGLRLLHQAGIVHRDVKSNNVIVPLGAPSQTVLVDLGTAKPQSGDSATRRSAEIGPAISGLYAAPEYFVENRANVQTDLYSLGVTAFEALVGLYPHEIELRIQRGVVEVPVKHLLEVSVQLDLANLRRTAPPRFPEEATTRLPAPVRELVTKLLAPQAQDRPATADEVVGELEALLGRFGGTTSTVVPVRSVETNTEGGHDTPKHKKRMLWPYAVASSVVGIAVAATMTMSPSSPNKQQGIRPTRTSFEPQSGGVVRVHSDDTSLLVPVTLQSLRPAGASGPDVSGAAGTAERNVPTEDGKSVVASSQVPNSGKNTSDVLLSPTAATGNTVAPGDARPGTIRKVASKQSTKLPSHKENAKKIREYSKITD